MAGQEGDNEARSGRLASASWFYPQFSGARDFGLFRIGGSGLANHLFIWAKSLALARRHGGHNVFPTWPQFKAGPIIRREPDPRIYLGLFQPAAQDVSGVPKLLRLSMTRRIPVSRIADVEEAEDALYVVDERALGDFFQELLEERDFVRSEFLKRTVRRPKAPASPFIGIHIRFGDFVVPKAGELSGAVNHRLPLEWYAGRLDVIRRAIGRDVPAVVFSDASAAELAALLAKPNVTFHEGGTALDDLWSLSQASVIIASGSTFSYWGGYLGQGVVVSRAGAWRTTFDRQPREWICQPDDAVVPEDLLAAMRRAGL